MTVTMKTVKDEGEAGGGGVGILHMKENVKKKGYPLRGVLSANVPSQGTSKLGTSSVKTPQNKQGGGGSKEKTIKDKHYE